ncbi:uncharacterized protein LOC115224337 [Argonauta hians]
MSKGYGTSKAYDPSKQYAAKSQDWAVGSTGMVLQPAQSVAGTVPGVMYGGAASQQGISINTGYPYGQQSMYVNQAPGMMSVGLQNSTYPNLMQIGTAPMPQYQMYGASAVQQMQAMNMSGASYSQVPYSQQHKYLDKDLKYSDVYMMSAANSSSIPMVGNPMTCMQVKNSPSAPMYTYNSQGMPVAYSSASKNMSGPRK